MLRAGCIAFAQVFFLILAARGADATTPVDYTQRNSPYAPGATVHPPTIAPEKAEAVQEKRVDKKTVEKKPAAVGEKLAAIDVLETQPKNVREKDSRRPQTIEPPKSDFDHREAAITTAADTRKPPLVSKYQDGLTSASATNMARFPALDKATKVKINRFVFRKNGTDAGAGVDPASATPVAGGSPVLK